MVLGKGSSSHLIYVIYQVYGVLRSTTVRGHKVAPASLATPPNFGEIANEVGAAL